VDRRWRASEEVAGSGEGATREEDGCVPAETAGVRSHSSEGEETGVRGHRAPGVVEGAHWEVVDPTLPEGVLRAAVARRGEEKGRSEVVCLQAR
jgi:hypothetical protein